MTSKKGGGAGTFNLTDDRKVFEPGSLFRTPRYQLGGQPGCPTPPVFFLVQMLSLMSHSLLLVSVPNFELRNYRSTAVEKMSVTLRQHAARITRVQVISLFSFLKCLSSTKS